LSQQHTGYTGIDVNGMDLKRVFKPIFARGSGWVVAGLLALLLVLVLPLPGGVDLDGNGVGDVWEWMYGARDADPQSDLDGDGSSTLEESVVGTDPDDPASKLGVDGLVQLPDGSLLARWFGASGKSYALEGLEDNESDNPQWLVLGTATVPLGVTNTAGTAPMSLVLPASFSERVRGRLRVAVSDVDSDGDGLNDWEEAVFGLDPAVAQTTPGVDDYAFAVAGLSATNVIEVEVQPGTIGETETAEFVVRRVGVGVQPLVIELDLGGSLLPGRDLNEVPASVVLPMFSNEVRFTVAPTGAGFPGDVETFSVTVPSGGDWFVAGVASQAVLTVEYTRPTIFSAVLRNDADPFLPTLGRATLAVNPERTEAAFEVSFDGPEAPNALVQLATLSDSVFFSGVMSGSTLNLPPGFLDTMESTNLVANVGDFSGVFHLADGNQPFAAPVAPPPFPTGPNAPLPNAAEASRFLAQCTFGPSPEMIAAVQALGFEAWIDQQMALPASHHLPFVENHGQFYRTDQSHRIESWSHRIESWWDESVRAPDQLRQRVAFALSQIFVISDRDSQIINYPYGTAGYNDLLLDGAFGSYRELLKAVSLHPMMGMYLSHRTRTTRAR